LSFRVSASVGACVICHITRIYQITMLRLYDDRALIPNENAGVYALTDTHGSCNMVYNIQVYK